MLTLNSNKNEHTTSFLFINNEQRACTNLITKNTSLIMSCLANDGLDTCSFYSGPSDSTIASFSESFSGSFDLAYTGGESCGSIAYTGGESCGSVASSCDSSCCSYCC